MPIDPVEEIRARVSIYDLVSEYVTLKKAGRNYKGLCPFHDEKTPSFIVSPDKGLAYCFGCHQGGDIFTFIELIERVDFNEAVKILAEKAHVELHRDSMSKTQKKKKQLKSIYEVVTQFYEQKLSESTKAMDYLKDRGVLEDTIKTFKLGYSPDSYKETHLFLLKKGYTHKEIIDAGLAIAKNLVELDIYDRFRGRLMFPICNVHGQVVAFGGRILQSKENDAKYLNSPETALYQKKYVLYGLDQAKDTIRKQKNVIVVEGYIDVLASHQAQIKNVVASSGTALTYEQVRLLKRYADTLYFSFDQDNAGQDAADRAIETALKEDMDIKIIQILFGKDPDECIREDKKLWEKSIKKAVPAMRFYFDYIYKKENKNDIKGKKAICNFLFPKIHKMPNLVEQNFYIKLLSSEINVDEGVLVSQMKQMRNTRIKRNFMVKEDESILKTTIFVEEDYLLGLLLEYPLHISIFLENLIFYLLSEEKVDRFYKQIKEVYNSTGNFIVSSFIEELDENEKKNLKILTLFIQEKYADFSAEGIKSEIYKLITRVNKKNFEIANKNFLNEVKKYEKENDKENTKKVLSKYTEFLSVYNVFTQQIERK